MKTTAFLLAGIASLSLASAAAAQVFSDGFEADTPGAPAGALINFETIGTVDVVDPATGEVAVSGTLGDRALKLVELAPGVTEDEIREKTEPALLS